MVHIHSVETTGVVLLTMVLSPARRVPGNLLPNGSFEAGRYGWYVHSQCCRGSRMRIEKAGAEHGRYCATVTRTSRAGTTFLMHEFINLEKDKDYTFSAWLRSDSEAMPVSLKLYCFDANVTGKWQEGKQDVTVTREWKRYHLKWRTPAARMDMYLPRIDLESPGVLYVDGAQIESPEL
ncbi:MAG: carbohydrate binding domain-containing protein, partial [Armatimonadetes bacterium]|nr:carbohydrate binding domain-containing protein [Armatimonadota bacterium]